MRESNIKLYSNIYLLVNELENDTEFHSQVRGRAALKHLLNKVIKDKENTKNALNNLQIAELNHTGVQLDNCKFKKAWGIVKDKNQNYFVECRCDYSECPQYNVCLNEKIYLIDKVNDIAELNEPTQNNNAQEYIEAIEVESITTLATDIEREVNRLENKKEVIELVEIKNSELIDEELLMNCLVSIERIAGDIIHLKDITERLDKDVNEIRKKIHETLVRHKKNKS